MVVVKAPEQTVAKERSVFLAGSIEMDKAEKWQERVTKELSDFKGTIYNPRRDDWDASWKQTPTDPQFKQQVEWELEHLDYADYIFMYFSPGTQSPVTLLELGLYAFESHRIMVVCPDGFWRKGNVEIVCDHYNISLFNTLEKGIEYLKTKLK